MLGFDGVKNPYPFPFKSSYDVKQRIQDVFSNHQAHLCELLQMLDWICLTVDVWSTKHRSFIGVTAHGIDSQSYEQKSVALCCTRFPHPHTGENIAEQMQLLYAIYNLTQSKVTYAVMDNPANFRKAFREYGTNNSTFDEYVEHSHEQIEKDTDYMNTSSSDESIFFPEILETTTLPNRISCSCHNFNLIGTTDICEAQNDRVYKSLYVTAFPKLNRFETKGSKSSEIIEKVLGCTLRRPINSTAHFVYSKKSTECFYCGQ